jgi:3-oxoadipate enol-lactonase
MIALCGDLEIGYDDVGTGLPLVLLHGFPHDRTLWAPQTSALLEHSRCIAPDLRGFGETTLAEARAGQESAGSSVTMERYADDVAVLLDALEIDRAVIGGLSMGGYVAFAFWRRHRARVRALLLADTRPGADSEETRAKRRELIALALARGSGAVADAQITGMVGRSTREKHPEIVEAVHRMLERASVEGIVTALEAMLGRPDSTSTLASIDVPTLIVVGEEDVLTPPREARAMHAAIAGSRLEILAGAGHVSNFERPAAFNHVLGEFLAALVYE